VKEICLICDLNGTSMRPEDSRVYCC